MFRILNSGRQSGATTYIINMICSDYKRNKNIGIVSNFKNFDNITYKIKSLINEDFFNKSRLNIINKPQDLIGMNYDEIYILDNLNHIEEELLERLIELKDIIYCDKVLVSNPIDKNEYDLAKYWFNNKDMNKKQLSCFYKACSNFNISNIYELKNLNIIKYPVEFLNIDNSFEISKRFEYVEDSYTSKDIIQGIFK